ncbi:hypothetical protein J7J90_01080 [Candidatus Micrarchaeota archaeon]|nr:hypothetical protein [Candidatus Micrarchaeota archaeon]
MRSEYERQIIHIILGILFIVLNYFIGRELLSILLFFVILLGLILMQIKLYHKYKLPYVDKLLFKFERPRVTPGLGSLWYVVGVFITGLMFIDFAKFTAVILILAIGDGFATIFGLSGRHPLPWNKRKTVEGTTAFIIGGSTVLLIYPSPLTFFIILLSAIGESIPSCIDDNILIPLIAGTLFFIF